MLAYREKNNLIHKLHPFTTVAFIGIVFILSLIFSHPVYLLALFCAVGLVIVAAGIVSEWRAYLKFTVSMMAILVMINALFVHNGDTILVSGPRLPILGKIEITLEALAYGAGMGIRLLVIISVFCLYTYAINPDKALKLFSKWGNKSVLAITLATRLFPLITQDFKRILDIQRCRGVKFSTGSWWKRIKNSVPVISVLLLSSLERSLQIAESMHARGYGSGSRSSFQHDLWRPRDFIILVFLFISLVLGIWAAAKGWSAYSYYPKLEQINLASIKLAGALIGTMVMPAVLSWGWKKWPLLRSKI